jgi:hypothetical protein
MMVLLLLSSGNELSTIGRCGKNPNGSAESMDSPLPLAINAKEMRRERERCVKVSETVQWTRQ